MSDTEVAIKEHETPPVPVGLTETEKKISDLTSDEGVLTFDLNDKALSDTDDKPLPVETGEGDDELLSSVPTAEKVQDFIKSDDESNKEKVIQTLDSTPSNSKKIEIIEHTVIKSATTDIAIKQMQSLPVNVRGRPKKQISTDTELPSSAADDNINGKSGTEYTFTSRNKVRRTFVTSDDIDKELEATMEKLEPRSSIDFNKNGTETKTKIETIENQDLIAILEGNDMGEIVTATHSEVADLEIEMLDGGQNLPDEAEIALQQMMSLPKSKRGRKPLPKSAKANTSNTSNASDIVSSIVNDWSDNEDQQSNAMVFEVTTSQSRSSPGETTIHISPARKPAGKSGAAKRKQPQGVVEDEPGSGSIEIIQTVEPPRIINKDANIVPMKFERRRVIKKKVIWDPDDPSPSFTSRIGNTTIKKVTKIKVEQNTQQPTKQIKTEELPNEKVVVAEAPKPKTKKRSGRSEIDKLLGDEGAINMIYSLERENKNADIPEIGPAVDEEQLLDVDEEKSNLQKKANALKKSVFKQTKTPPGSGARQPRVKREPVPVAAPITPPASTSTTPVATTISPPTPTNKKQTAGRKRKTAESADSWDYVYSSRRTRDDDSMIIRRRSNSSYSSTTSPRRLSIDQSAQLSDPDTTSNKRSSTEKSTSETPPAEENHTPPAKKQKGKGFEFAKPNAKKSAINKPVDTSKLVAQIKGKLKAKPVPVSTASNKDTISSPEKKKILDSKQLSIKKYDKFALLILPSIDGKLKDCLTLQLLNKMIAALKQLENDSMCNAVVVTSSGVDFCRGINYSILIQVDEEKRKNAAREFASAVRKFIFALATFPKPLICGLQGEVCGIGVMILPLFDLVLAREDVKLSAPYGLIGHFPEGLSVLRLLNKIKTRTTSELFYLNKKLEAEDAVEHELVTKIVTRTCFNDEILSTARLVVASSPQALLSIKQNLTKDLIEQIDEALAEEEQMLIRHWVSAECQEKFKNYMTKGHW